MKKLQVAIIGGGVIGSNIAFELSRYNLEVAVFEKGIDVCSEISKANSGVIHSGINSAPGSLKARYCVEGNKVFQNLSEQLGFSLEFIGKYVIAKNQKEIKELERLKEIGRKNNVPGLEIKKASEVKKIEPNVSCIAALWVPTAGIILPYEFTISLAENAAINKVKFYLETKVSDLEKQKDGFLIKTSNGDFKSDVVVNAAGLSSREIVSMLEEPNFQIFPCRGEYLVLDKRYSNLVNSMIYPVPEKELGVLGVHITPTIEGNILLGPSAEFIDDSKDKKTTKKNMQVLFSEAKEIIPNLPEKSVINAYSGIRCKLAPPEKGGWADYNIFDSKENPGFINLPGIESPGLTASPAIAKDIVDMVSNYINIEKKKNFKIRKKEERFNEMALGKQKKSIQEDGRWGRIVCRCEHITEAEIINALDNPLGARSISSVKYRCRAGMGRCQGGFCTQHIIRIMEEKIGMNISDIKFNNPNSNMFVGRTREEK